MLYDVFISHASEDKDDFVRPLVELLEKEHIKVWYDEFTLNPGDSLRRSIDTGLAKSRFGIVVLSRNFLKKEWTQWELDGLVQRQNNERQNLILPIWHNITKEELIKFSPSLVDKVAVQSNSGVNKVAQSLIKVIRPEGSTLLIARDVLIDHGFEPPVVTDDWWLDVIASSASNPVEDTFQDAMGWGRWGFPLPSKSDLPEERGERLAWAAMQMSWQQEAEAKDISQITHPENVIKFIQSQPGLEEACRKNLTYLVAYAPQLTISGMGGIFEDDLKGMYEFSCKKQEKLKEENSISGTGLTINKELPTCWDITALRDSNFGFYEPSHIACNFVQGDLMGPEVQVYEKIDYILWLLSDNSSWMPKNIRNFLLEGLKEWNVWLWHRFDHNSNFVGNGNTGSLSNAMFKSKSVNNFKVTKKVEDDLKSRFEYTKRILNLNEDVEKLYSKFLNAGFIEAWINKNKHAHKKPKKKKQKK